MCEKRARQIMKKTVGFLVLFLTLFAINEGEKAYGQSMMLENFDQSVPPVNKEGSGYPSAYSGVGAASVSINTSDAVSGNSLRLRITSGGLQAQFNPYNGTSREFARTYAGCGWPPACGNPSSWQLNTYNRMRLWVKLPPQVPGHETNGSNNMNMGTYVKAVTNASASSDESGGNHYYHNMNIPNLGTWVQYIINAHPDHVRGAPGAEEEGVRLYPTTAPYGSGDPPNTYNYFDTLTRFYVQINNSPSSYPADVGLDQIEFYREPHVENDQQIYSIASTYIPGSNRVIITWSRDKNENSINHEVRYAFSDIHALGWANATPAPNGVIVPPGWQGYNGMVYDTTALPVVGKSHVYMAIKPQNSNLFSQIVMPLSGSLPSPDVTDTRPPEAPTNLRVGP
jgi:hypothetical protein